MESQSTTPPINPEAWQEFVLLWADDPPSVLADLIDEYLHDSESRLGLIRSGLSRGDAELVERAAHTLKSSSANLGAQLLEEECRVFQELAREADLEGLAARLDRLMGVFEATRKAMAAERKRIEHDPGPASA